MKGFEYLIKRKPATASYSATFAAIFATAGAILAGPKGAVVLGAIGGGVGGYLGAKIDESSRVSDRELENKRR